MDEKYLIYESRIEQDVDAERLALHLGDPALLNERFIVCASDVTIEFLAYEILDLFTGESREVKFYTPNSQYHLLEFHWLSIGYGLITGQSNETLYGNFVKIDWTLNEFQTVEQFERNGQDLDIFPDKLDPSKFLLRIQVGNVHSHQFCNVVKGKVQFDQVYQSQNAFSHHFNGKLFALSQLEQQFFLDVFDLATKKEESFETGPLPDNVNTYESSFVTWTYERAYITVCYQNAGNYDIAWLDLKTRQWKLLDFEVDLRIEKLLFVNGNLLVHTGQSNEHDGIFTSTKKFYSIQMRRPRLLRDSAWLLMVKIMEEKNELDPYGAAMKYVPLNTDIRPPWFDDKGKSDEKPADDKHSQSMEAPDEASKDEPCKDESGQNPANSTEGQTPASSTESQRVETQEKQTDGALDEQPKPN